MCSIYHITEGGGGKERERSDLAGRMREGCIFCTLNYIIRGRLCVVYSI